jgi:thiol-disulfide isomerase/thioredoxin
MTKNQKIGAACVFFILLVIGLKVYKKYHVAPDIKFKTLELTDLNGNKVDWQQIPKPVFINYFGTWCIDCKQEMPALVALQAMLKKQNISMILISDERTETLNNYAIQSQLPIPIYHSVANFKDIGIVQFPTSYLLNQDDIMVYSVTGVQPWTDPALVQKMLSKIQ